MQLKWLGAEASTVPVLSVDGRLIQGSSAIVGWADDSGDGPALTPAVAGDAAASRALESRLDEDVAGPVRALIYSQLVGRPEVLGRLWTARGPWWAGWFYGLLLGRVIDVVRHAYRLDDPAALARQRERLGATLTHCDELLGRSPFLGGDTIGRADIALAAFLAPVFQPAQHPVAWPADPVPIVSELLAELEGRPVLRHARRLYAEYRARRP